MGNCTKCELYKTSRVKSNNKIYECVCLPGEGPKTAKIMLLGMCPGKTEIINKKPFVGDSGQMLNACLQEAGLSRKDLYITNLVKCRSLPVEKKPGYWEDREPNTKEIKACLPYLEEEIKEIKPNVIVCLGNLVSKTIIGKTNITQIHGNPFWSNKYQTTCIPLYHPSFLVRRKDGEGLKNRKDFIEDLKFVKQSAISSEFTAKTKKKTKYITCDTLPKVVKAIKRLNSVPEFAFDIETTGLSVDDDRPLCISFSWAEATAIVIPIWDWQRGELWNQEDLAYIKSHLKLVMENPNIKKIGHNISFDIFFLNKKWGWDIQGAYFDTMFGYYLLDPDRKGSQKLHDLAWIYTDMGGYDEKVKADRENGFKNTAWDDLYEYSAGDSDCTYRIKEVTKKDLEPYMFVMTEIMVPLSIITAEMRYIGIQIDVEYLDKLTQEYAKRIEEQEKAINELSDIKMFSENYLKKQRKEILAKYEKSKLLKKKYTQEEYLNKNIQAVNLGSTKQLRELLFSHLGLPVVKRTKQSKDASTDEASLELLKGEHEFIDMLLELRYLKKLHSTYLSPIREKLDKNNRLHTDYSLSRTATGRLASSNINLQNIPKKKDGKLIRDYFVASPGNVLVSSDLSQIEYRILAHYVNDPKQIQDIASGQDIHREVAASAYKIPIDKVTSEQRDGAKAITFGLPYGRSSISLAEEYGMSPEEAEEYIRAFFGKYPKVKLWIDTMIKVARQKGYVKNFFGRKRYLPKINDQDNFIRGEEERKVVSTCIQGSASDILSLDTIRVAKRLKELKSKARLVLTIHDDIVLDTPKEELEQIVELLRTEMQRPIEGIRVPLKTEIKIGERWGSLEKYEEQSNAKV
jgi:uracil-DNA glycosylase family 4